MCVTGAAKKPLEKTPPPAGVAAPSKPGPANATPPLVEPSFAAPSTAPSAAPNDGARLPPPMAPRTDSRCALRAQEGSIEEAWNELHCLFAIDDTNVAYRKGLKTSELVLNILWEKVAHRPQELRQGELSDDNVKAWVEALRARGIFLYDYKEGNTAVRIDERPYSPVDIVLKKYLEYPAKVQLADKKSVETLLEYVDDLRQQRETSRREGHFEGWEREPPWAESELGRLHDMLACELDSASCPAPSPAPEPSAKPESRWRLRPYAGIYNQFGSVGMGAGFQIGTQFYAAPVKSAGGEAAAMSPFFLSLEAGANYISSADIDNPNMVRMAGGGVRGQYTLFERPDGAAGVSVSGSAGAYDLQQSYRDAAQRTRTSDAHGFYLEGAVGAWTRMFILTPGGIELFFDGAGQAPMTSSGPAQAHRWFTLRSGMTAKW